jgi:polysaccharide deacetylase 2 family uncharacterized protein YibQ
MRRQKERAPRKTTGKPARGMVWTFWTPAILLVAQALGIVALMAWLLLNADDTKSRRALRVPYAVADFDLAHPLTDSAFKVYRTAMARQQAPKADTLALPPPAAENFKDVRFEGVPPALPRPKDDLPAPPIDANLMEVSPFGPLPVISPDGRASWQVYSQPVDASKISVTKGTVAIVVENAGLSEPALRAFLDALPPPVTFAFNPYAPELDYWIGRTRARGHEVLMGLPMEPRNFPTADPGPRALMKDYNEARAIEAMKWSLGRGAGYVGLLTIMGDSFTETAWRIDPVLREIGKRGLLFVDSTTEAGRAVTQARAEALGLPYAAARFRIGDDVAQDAIQEIFSKTQAAAQKNGEAVLVVSPYPVVLSLLQQWLPMLAANDVALVPVSYVAEREMARRQKE